MSAAARAQPAPAAAASTSQQRIVELRVALSPGAAEHLGDLRLRRLLEIELGESAVLAPGTSGPLGDHVAYIWIDEPTPSHFAIEVRIGDRPVARRELNLTGFPGDVATRFTVVATTEMVRAQMQPLPKKRVVPEKPKPTPAEIEVASRSRPAVGLVAGFDGLGLPEVGGALAGPSLGASFRMFRASETVFGRLLTGHSDAGATRFIEGGLGLDYRFWLGPEFRLGVGGALAFTAVHLGDASVDRIAGANESWTARGGGRVGIERHLGGGAWLGLALEPGALLRPVPYSTSTSSGSLRGAYLGATIALTLERVSPPQL